MSAKLYLKGGKQLMSDSTVYDAGTLLYNSSNKILRIADGTNSFDNLPDIRKEGKTFTLTTSGWNSGNVSGEGNDDSFQYYYDLTVSEVTATDVVMGLVNSSDVSVAKAAGVSDNLETINGKIRFRSVSVPTASISGHWWIESIV